MRIGILSSIPKEIKHFNFNLDSNQIFGGKIFFTTKMYKKELIIVECGIGKVNAAIAATLLIQNFKCDLLIFSGIAGGIDPLIKIGDVILGDRVLQYDYGAIENGNLKVFKAGEIPIGKSKKNIFYKLDKKFKNLIRQNMPNLKMGKIITGDTYVNCKNTRKYLSKKFGAQVVDMEGGAVAQVVEQFGKNAIIIRCVSDLAGEIETKILTENLNLAAKRSSETVKEILKIF